METGSLKTIKLVENLQNLEPILEDLVRIVEEQSVPPQYTYTQADYLASITNADSPPIIIFVSTAGGEIFTSVGFWGWDKTNWIQF